ncbi:CGNR zinc finger domain-containing protein [Actinoplanes sp. TBRC 11911]|uniref:CGNR zinc finger domain-containing protein n=1 Tax=Actinoplanes sp. TBRC 11911 TaxID=2729386 RepID=UPI00145D7A7B|nr:CGNR zinc finger domain-containing protein [Actinoplanes sp. TBRC 11911]NMO56092.1 CGNR zinc finger domain-containing protein [Actinoplanes sp. TBRC 11911]
MVFSHDTETALAGAAALVNTAGRDGEELPDTVALDHFFVDQGWTGRIEGTAAELRAVQELRPRLRRLWESGEDEVVAMVNGLLREFHALPQLVRHHNWPYHLHATPQDAPLATRMAVDAAMAFVDVVREGQLDRLRICEFPDCGNVVVDLTRNRSKRFCEAGCGNRAAVNAYRARKAATRA